MTIPLFVQSNLSLFLSAFTFNIGPVWTISYRVHLYFQSLLLLSCFSRVRLCTTPETAAHQAPPSLEFSRQEHWSGLPFPSPMHESKKWKWSRSVVSDSYDPMDCSLPGSSVHGILQARIWDWVAISFSRESSQPRNQTWVSCTAGRFFTDWATREVF